MKENQKEEINIKVNEETILDINKKGINIETITVNRITEVTVGVAVGKKKKEVTKGEDTMWKKASITRGKPITSTHPKGITDIAKEVFPNNYQNNLPNQTEEIGKTPSLEEVRQKKEICQVPERKVAEVLIKSQDHGQKYQLRRNKITFKAMRKLISRSKV